MGKKETIKITKGRVRHGQVGCGEVGCAPERLGEVGCGKARFGFKIKMRKRKGINFNDANLVSRGLARLGKVRRATVSFALVRHGELRFIF